MTEQHTGGMLALVPDNPARLAVDGGDEPGELHLTLLYLGDDVSAWPEGQADSLREIMTASAPALDAVDARIIGPALFNPDGGPNGDRDPCLVLLVADAPDLEPVRRWAQWVLTTHEEYATPPDQHQPYIPHVTVANDILGHGYESSDDGPSASSDGRAGDRVGGATTKRLPAVDFDAKSLSGGGVDTERGQRQGGPSAAGGSSREAGPSDQGGRGSPPHLPNLSVRGGDASSRGNGASAPGAPRGGETADALHDSQDSVRAAQQQGPRQVQCVPLGESGPISGTEPGLDQREGAHQVKDARSQSQEGGASPGAPGAAALAEAFLDLNIYTGPVRFSTLRLALAGQVWDIPLGDQEAPVSGPQIKSITFTPSAEVRDAATGLDGETATAVIEGKALDAEGLVWVAAHCGDVGREWATEMLSRVEVKRAGMKMGETEGGDRPKLDSLDDLDADIDDHGNTPATDRPARVVKLRKRAHALGAGKHVHDRIGSLEGATTDGSGSKSLEDGVEVKIASPDPRAARLRDMWAHDPKLTKKWRPGTPGDFKRLRRHLAKYVHTPAILNGLTANIHKLATGEWPGKNAHTGKGNVGKKLVTAAKSIDWDDIEAKTADLADADLAALYDGVDDWGSGFVADDADAYLAGLDGGTSDDDPGADDAPTDDSARTARFASMKLIADGATPAAETGVAPAAETGQAPTETGWANLFDPPPAAEPVSA